MDKIENLEEKYNCDSYADFLSNKHFHHSEKGCQIEMIVIKRGRPGEIKIPVLIKRCLTHNVDCHKEGFEIGMFNGVNSPKGNFCDCGKTIPYRSKSCPECSSIKSKENKKLYALSHKEEVKKRRQEKRHQEFLKNNNGYKGFSN